MYLKFELPYLVTLNVSLYPSTYTESLFIISSQPYSEEQFLPLILTGNLVLTEPVLIASFSQPIAKEEAISYVFQVQIDL